MPITKPIDQRNAEIFARRKAGETYAAIAKDYNLAPNTVRTICVQQNALQTGGRRSYPPEHIWHLPLKTGAYHGLLNAGITTRAQLAALSDAQLRAMLGVGPIYRAQIKLVRDAYCR